MAQSPLINLRFFASGYCEANESIVNPLTGKGKCKFYAVWALLYMPEFGHILFDTGYSEAFYHATHSFPERLYRWATPVILKPTETAKAILANESIKAEEINYVIISHFHADHIAGLKDFPNAKIICSKTAYNEVAKLKRVKAVSKGILYKLLPADLEGRLVLLEDFAQKKSVNNYGITEFEVFNTTAFKLILLPGHAKGMLGFIFQKDEQSLLYATDASWSYDTYDKEILPKKIVQLFFDSWNDYVETRYKLKAYEKAYEKCTVLFTHCAKTLNYITNEV
jgi:glyoxylase-like metal-dependent hydrolase (beta-lactamase superfamily II)